ncbi:hypothetical protein Q5A_021045 [Serratia inhibens PRI-2C]|nr:hypothetical protein Q5A_021045 [Serratia inhibens PRI-2C]
MRGLEARTKYGDNLPHQQYRNRHRINPFLVGLTTREGFFFANACVILPQAKR